MEDLTKTDDPKMSGTGDPTDGGDPSRTIMASQTRLRIGVIEADAGGTAVWNVGDKTVSIWFPKQGVFDKEVIVERVRGDANGEIRVKVPLTPITQGPSRQYKYCMYCHDDDEFVEWHSHPIMVIPKP